MMGDEEYQDMVDRISDLDLKDLLLEAFEKGVFGRHMTREEIESHLIEIYYEAS